MNLGKSKYVKLKKVNQREKGRTKGQVKERREGGREGGGKRGGGDTRLSHGLDVDLRKDGAAEDLIVPEWNRLIGQQCLS